MTLTKQFDARVKAIDARQGIVTSVVAVYGNVDAQNDRILPGAFDASIAKWKSLMSKGKFLPVVYGHRDDPSFILGKVVDLRSTSEGLEVDEQYFKSKPVSQDVLDATVEGVLGGSSFAYDVIRAKRAEDGVQNLIELDLIEVGPTIYPANDATRLVGVKATDPSAWDANRAMGMCSTEAQYRQICAAEHDIGQPDERQHWAGAHHFLGRGPNEGGVRVALSRWGTEFGGTQVENITEEQWSRGLSHLRGHMREMNPDYSPPGASEAPESKAGAVFSTATRRQLETHISSLRSMAQDMEDWMNAQMGDKAEDPEVKAEVGPNWELEQLIKSLTEGLEVE